MVLEYYTLSLSLSVQKPDSCFPLNYSVTLSQDEGLQPLQTNPVPGSEMVLMAEVTGLRENMVFSASLSATNNFQFSIDNPQTSNFSFGGWSHWWVWSHVSHLPHSDIRSAVSEGDVLQQWNCYCHLHLCLWLSLFWLSGVSCSGQLHYHHHQHQQVSSLLPSLTL